MRATASAMRAMTGGGGQPLTPLDFRAAHAESHSLVRHATALLADPAVVPGPRQFVDWPCPACTFDNQGRASKCNMCQTARPETVEAATVAAAAEAGAQSLAARAAPMDCEVEEEFKEGEDEQMDVAGSRAQRGPALPPDAAVSQAGYSEVLPLCKRLEDLQWKRMETLDNDLLQ